MIRDLIEKFRLIRDWYPPFTLRTHQIFSVHTTLEEFKKRQLLPVILNLCFREIRSGKSQDYRNAIVFEKLRFQNVFRPQENEKLVLSNSSFLKSVQRKASFSWQISLEGRPNRRNKAAF